MYRGLWHGAHVAVKVLDKWITVPAGSTAAAAGEASTEVTGHLKEALMGHALQHPHVVQTYEFCSRIEQVGCLVGGGRAREQQCGGQQGGGARCMVCMCLRMDALADKGCGLGFSSGLSLMQCWQPQANAASGFSNFNRSCLQMPWTQMHTLSHTPISCL